MRYNLSLCVVVILLISGCTAWSPGTASEQKNPVQLEFNNTANETQTFKVWVVEGEIQPDSIHIYKQDSEVDYASPGQGLSSYYLGGDYGYVTYVKPPTNRSRLFGQFILKPGENSGSNVGNFTVGSTIVVSMSQDGRVIELVTANCNELVLIGLRVIARPNPPGGASAAYECR